MAIYFNRYRDNQVVLNFGEGDLQAMQFEVAGLQGTAAVAIQALGHETAFPDEPSQADPKEQSGVVLIFEEAASLCELINQLTCLLQEKLEYELDCAVLEKEKGCDDLN